MFSVHSFCLICDVKPASLKRNEVDKVVAPALRIHFGCLH